MFVRTKAATYFDYLPRGLFAEGDPDPAADPVAGGPAPADPPIVDPPAPSVEGDPPPDDPAKKQTPWFQKRINELTAEKHEAHRQREATAAELTVLRAQLEATQRNGERSADDPASPPGEAGKRPLTEAEIEAEVDKRAAQKAAQLALNEACNRTASEGSKTFEDFIPTRDGLMQAFGDKINARPDFLEAVTDLPNGHEVFYRLGKDLDLAAEVLALTPTKMGIRLAQIAAEVKSKPVVPVSKTPPPIRTVDGSARATEPSVYDAGTNKIDIAAWIRLRDKQERDDKVKKYSRAS